MAERELNKKNIIEEIYNSIKIDWTDFYAEFGDCQNDSPVKFELMPQEYLEFAKNNLKSETKQSCIDAMGNAKRAIECQIDMLINTLGYDYKQFDSRNAYPEVKIFIKNNYQGEQYSGITDRVKLLNILGLAPTLVIANIRHMRNQMEHEYSSPPYDEVKKAIEIADLFINSSNRKLSYASTILEIGNRLKKEEDRHGYLSGIKYPYIRMRFCIYQSIDTVSICAVRRSLENCQKGDKDTLYIPIIPEDKFGIELKPEDKFYIETIYSLITQDCSMLPMIFNNYIDKKHIKYTCI